MGYKDDLLHGELPSLVKEYLSHVPLENELSDRVLLREPLELLEQLLFAPDYAAVAVVCVNTRLQHPDRTGLKDLLEAGPV